MELITTKIVETPEGHKIHYCTIIRDNISKYAKYIFRKDNIVEFHWLDSV